MYYTEPDNETNLAEKRLQVICKKLKDGSKLKSLMVDITDREKIAHQMNKWDSNYYELGLSIMEVDDIKETENPLLQRYI